MSERLKKETVMLRKRRDLVVVTLLAATISTGGLYVMSISGFARDDDPAMAWQQAVAGAASAEESAAALSSRSRQEESGRLARVVIGDGHALLQPETRVDEVERVDRCLRLAAQLLTRIAGTVLRGQRRDFRAHTARHTAALRAMCATAPRSGALEQCLGGASGAGDIAACAGAELSAEQYAAYRVASEAIMSAGPDQDASGDEAPFRPDSSYETLLNELLAQLPERERESARTLIVESLRQHLEKERP